MVRVRVESLNFSDGHEVVIPAEGVVLFVGPNNTGKSQALKDVVGFQRDGNFAGRVLSTVDYERSSDVEVADWVADSVPQMTREGISRYQVEGWGEVQLTDIVNHWARPILGPLTAMFILHADGTSRLTAGDSQPSIDFSQNIPAHPVQRAYRDSALEFEIEQESKAAFGLGVTVDRYGGSVISLRLGERPAFEHDEGRPSDAYLGKLKALPKLEEQGDGVRSYLGLVLHIAGGTHQVLLIDEPEAFLHPPQARRLGSVLAKKAKAQQAFVATHSSDIVRGALESESVVTIIRITREGDVNHPAVLNHEAVTKLWADPLLRYSNVLDGLFHDAVVLCESDADCRYYSAVLDNLTYAGAEEGPSPERDPQLLFTHCGGKARIASVVSALRAVSVPVIVVADFDILRVKADVERVVTALGGEPAQFEKDRAIVATALEADTKPLRKLTLTDDLVRRLEDLPNETLTPDEAEGLRAAIRSETGWDKAKRSGSKAVPQGDATQACERLLDGLRTMGLLVVPVGELERFAPGVGGHGPSWVTSVLDQDLHLTPEAEARSFVESIRARARAGT